MTRKADEVSLKEKGELQAILKVSNNPKATHFKALLYTSGFPTCIASIGILMAFGVGFVNPATGVLISKLCFTINKASFQGDDIWEAMKPWVILTACCALAILICKTIN
jgi:hypothetical protein